MGKYNLVHVIYIRWQFHSCTMKITYSLHKCQMSRQFGLTVKILLSLLTIIAYVAQTGLGDKASV